jgi:predicted dienelactone hydrolase
MPIEQRYEHTGSHPVTTQIVTDPASGGTFALYYPSNLADTTHPIVTWGNGTGAHPQDYDTLLRHLASWGFVVIDSTNSQTGNGTDMLAGATYLLHRNATSGDQFHNRIDTAHIAAVGHSQGATGALNATRLSNGMITTTVPIGLPTKASIAGLAPLPADVHGLTG